jgi:hypothetical protein
MANAVLGENACVRAHDRVRAGERAVSERAGENVAERIAELRTF